MVGGYRGRARSFLKGMNDSLKSYVFRPDTVNRKIEIFPRGDSSIRNSLAYHYPDKEHLVVQGSWKGDSIYVRMKIYDLNKFMLVNRGFHWVNEFPMNR